MPSQASRSPPATVSTSVRPPKGRNALSRPMRRLSPPARMTPVTARVYRCGGGPRVSGAKDGSVGGARGLAGRASAAGGVRMDELQARQVLKEFGIQVTQFMGRRRELREQAASAIQGEDRASVAAV